MFRTYDHWKTTEPDPCGEPQMERRDMNTKTQNLIEALEDAGYEWTDYSGRGMFGTRCVGVTLERDADLFTLGQALGELDALGVPSTDNMGRGLIVYWPQCKIDGGEK